MFVSRMSPDPVEQPDDIILRVTAYGDLRIGSASLPREDPKLNTAIFLATSSQGEVVETGREVKTLQKGDRVVIQSVIACGDCFFCRLQVRARPARAPTPGQGAALNKSKFPRLPRCLATAIFGGVPGGQANTFGCPA